ncbi:undecaprenyl-diphosphate phosphatase [Arcticibacterium luteifluviistationis]|uniref:Undecaprenyl-diphosphatase n=1 Tax=Arcticibacterium luteifluviistationis TaxID=1784714 RepID=A0A2Z4G8G1_9BACT|nr:undecaprenyl-diphosphate phosphatase [Arcticibacterium luteifluviistationis]AWV97333.1 UDP-diphosphatase [Arcticibacterium luteifluviistationis]
MDYIQAIILAIIEGITEYLPVSSTGHMIIASSIMGIDDQAFTKIFEVQIQFGAILSVIVLYWKRFIQSLDFYYKLLVAFIPAAVIGLLLNDYIDMLLENVVVVAVMLVLGGIVLLFIDKVFEGKPQKDDINYSTALKIGFFQCIAMIPGVSRSAASIIGGMTQGLTRKSSAEFSFFLAVPTMFAAAAYKMLKGYMDGNLSFNNEEIKLLIIGNVVAFIVALAAIKFFIEFLQKYGFKVFGYYRIVLGLIILGMLGMGYDLSV